jgi:hypothetical protein
MHPLTRFLLGSSLALAGSGCQSDFVPQSAILGLRVLAVRSVPASGSPGATIALDMLLADDRPPITSNGKPTPQDVAIAWLGGCHNPPGRQYYACLPALQRLAGGMTSGDGQSAPADVAFGTNLTHFEEKLPDDILSAAPKLSTDPVHYGVSYVFFAVCTGTLAPDVASPFPVTCKDASGASIGPSGFVIGFATIYSYDGEENQNPVLASVAFDGVPMPMASPDAASGLVPCTTDDDCAGVMFAHAAACSASGVCAPSVGPCNGSACPGFRVSPELSPASVESYSGGDEIIWASYYGTHGSFGDDTRLVVDRMNGIVGDYSSIWKPPGPNSDGSRRTARLWVTLNDERGGATWGFFDVVVQ